MAQSRQHQVCLESTPYYHCIVRCVRRAFLCGKDAQTGQCFDHRKQWIVDALKCLSGIFSVDVAAYAVMSNHFHVVVHVDSERAESWSKEEVICRWYKWFSGHVFVDEWLAGVPLTQGQQEVVDTLVETWRSRLYDLSWFMRCLNLSIACAANQEDGCTGHFWEGRFKSQALLDADALLTCMSYVDLNPIRAGNAMTPESSEFTSIEERVREIQSYTQGVQPGLMPFLDEKGSEKLKKIPFSLQDYLVLIDWLGRAFVAGKGGAIPRKAQPILERLRIDPEIWRCRIERFGTRIYKAVGGREGLQIFSRNIGQSWVWSG